MPRIFLVEDNANLREAVSSYLKLENHEVIEFSGVRGVKESIDTKKPHLIILDVMLPDGNGFFLAKEIKRHHAIPIIFLTAKTSESDRITGFEIGADDYVVKPFSPKELVLRVQALLKRTGKDLTEDKGVWLSGGNCLEMEVSTHRAKVDGKEIGLTAAEWKILDYLARQAGIVIKRERLLGETLNYLSAEGSERTVDTHIKNIRAKLGESAWIETVRSFGYRFNGEKK